MIAYALSLHLDWDNSDEKSAGIRVKLVSCPPMGLPMSIHRAWRETAVVVVGLWVSVAALAQSEPPKPPAEEKSASARRADADDVPLPDGAIGRLGSARFRYPAGAIGPVTFSPDGKLLAISSNGVLLFDVATGQLVHQLQLPDGYHSPVVRFLADGKRIAVGSRHYPRTARLTFYTLADGQAAPSPDFTGQRATEVIDVTPDGSRALLLEWGKQAYLWDFRAGRELWAFEHTRASEVLPLTPDGKWFVVTGLPQAELRDAATGKVAAKFPDAGRRFNNWHGAGQSSDGRTTVEARTGEDAVAVLTSRGPAAGIRTLPADRDPGRCLFSPDSRYLVGAGPFGTQVWDLAAADDQGPIARLPAATTAGFSPDGKTLALAGEGFVALVSVGDWKVLPQSADPPPPSTGCTSPTTAGGCSGTPSRGGCGGRRAAGRLTARSPATPQGFGCTPRWRSPWCRPTAGWPPNSSAHRGAKAGDSPSQWPTRATKSRG